jgi:hypothetical protein
MNTILASSPVSLSPKADFLRKENEITLNVK